ncbi:TetR/AcrR family transcriptional regulator [Aeromicrobium sp.]|uniref:TetR/AcrR family transcriptional regulator n=1 Tax=Aeromicrobium sp. TaxID=1871063 RepID=UPI002FCA14B5
MSPSQQDRREATRGALLTAGRRLFAERGFAGVPADEIVSAAGVTRGALHHHFGDKRGLFRVVFEQLEGEIVTDLGRLVGEGSDDLVRRALAAFLDICERPDVRRIALTDAPGVLGWQTWREIEAEHGLGLLIAMLADSPTVSRATPAPVLAQLVLGSITEAALLIAHADDRAAARKQAEASLLALYGDLLP